MFRPRVKLAGSDRGAMPDARVARKIGKDERVEVTVRRIAIECRQDVGLLKSVGGWVLSRTA
jgi:hypothetical protein